MTFEIIIEDKALKEAQDAYDYYEEQQAGLGERFKEALDKDIHQIQAHPRNYSKTKKNVRQKLLNGFPFLIVYEIFNNVIIIYAVFHQNRNPRNKFKKR